ncbi:biotin synthase BioB [Hydrogenophilus thermoluteolus]|uniref:Biotin synthase n=1 Tax=Hydrogenophilus thermoluteolus TaxID=297 RepID=A0A2Z6DZ04_HYDTE|nr:biotin synthase BioB [Hydrogenophilus thermoluteolus]BBD77568.1 biotin synthase [Hydrogenophilus thermoluteolus]
MASVLTAPAATTRTSETSFEARKAQLREWFSLPFFDLLHRAHETHRRHFPGHRVQRSTLLSIKTGGCSEDCGYCSQSARYEKATGLSRQRLLSVDEVRARAEAAKAAGASRFCMGAAWRGPKGQDLDRVAELIASVKALGLETCVTLGMLTDDQAARLKAAGLDYYNHNVDTAPEYYDQVITTHTLQDRLRTLEAVRKAGIKVCCGGIIGMGETREDRISMLALLADLDPPPESVPINQLVPIPGTPLGDQPPLDPFEFVRTIAVARLAMPTSYVRLSAGRKTMSDELQALCFYAGANSIFYGDALLTTGNPDVAHDNALFERLGLQPE